MEKLFIDGELQKIRHDNFDLKSLRKNGKQIIGCSFYKDGIGYILNAYVVNAMQIIRLILIKNIYL